MIEIRPDLAKVLVVDDLPLNRKLQQSYLSEVGYQVAVSYTHLTLPTILRV